MKNYYKKVMESVEQYSVSSSTLKDLIAVLVGSSANEGTCERIASLSHNRLFCLTEDELENEYRLSSIAAKRLVAALRIQTKVKITGEVIKTPADAANIFDFIRNEDQEHLVVAFMNTKNRVVKKEVISKGTINAAILHPRDVYKRALREGCSKIILGHNHPTGDPKPSREDIEATRRLIDAGDLVGIDLLDHIIVAGKNYYSMKERGQM